MSGDHEVIELLRSSDEASSSASEPRRAQQSPSSEEEEKQQRKPPKRRLVRSSRGASVATSRRRKRVASSESESSRASDSSEEERRLLKHLKKPAPKKTRVAATTAHVASTSRTRPDRRADGEMRQITEGMSFSELQAQERMMARFQNQNRRKGSGKQHAAAAPARKAPVARASGGSARRVADRTSSSELQAQDRALAQFHMQKARKSAPAAPTRRSDSESDEDEDSEGRDDEWEAFTRKSTHREASRKHSGAVEKPVDARRQDRESPPPRTSSKSRRPVEKRPKEHKTVKPRAGATRKPSSTRRRVLLSASRSSSEEESQVGSEEESDGESQERSDDEESEEEIVRRRSRAPKPGKPKQRAVPRKPRSSSSEREFELQGESELESEEDDVVIVDPPEPPRQQDPRAHKAKAPKRPEAPASASKRQADSPPLDAQAAEGAAQVSTGLALPRRSDNIAEKMSIEELQAQEKALQFFHAQKRRNNATASSTGRKGAHATNGGGANEANGTHSTNGGKATGSGRRARMGINHKATPDMSASLSYVAPPSRSGLSTLSVQSVSPAGCTATEEKRANPVVHSTAWRRLVFEEAPPNVLHAVSAIPYRPGFDKPLWAYDPAGKLKRKCRFLASLGQGVALTEANFQNQSPVQQDVDRQVLELVEKELPDIKACHAHRVSCILEDTRKQLKEYLKAGQVLRGELYRPLQWSEIANHQAWLDISPIERVTAKRMAQSPTHIVQPYNSLVGDVRYVMYRDQAALASWVCPETVTHLSNDITAIRRSFTMIGVRKNAFVEDDPVLRYVPYLGDGERMVIDNDLYTETTMSKERRIAVFGEGEELKVLNPGARDDETMEYLLRVIVGKCGGSEQVFLALQHVAGFDRPRVDYCEMMELSQAERRTARRLAQVRKLLASPSDSPRSKVLQELAQSYWFLRGTAEPQSLAQRLQPPVSVFESSYVQCPEALGIRDHDTYEGLVEWHRDLFCRRCYTYDCSEHGIQNPQRSYRADPIYPMVTAPGIVLARQEAPPQDSAENSSASPTEVIELTSSSSEDEAQEGKKEAPSDAAEQPSEHPVAAYRRSRRAQTRISSLASKSLQTQEKRLETERLAELEKRRKRREKFARAADKSEYLDNSYVPAITATLKKLLSETQPCSASCWLSAGDEEPSEDAAPLSRVDAVLVRKLASTFGPSACVVSALVKSPSCTCAQIAKFLAVEKQRRDSGGDLMRENGASMPAETRRKGRRHGGRVASNRSLAQRVGSRARTYDREKKLSYKPCNHDGVCDDKCDCTLRGHSCGKACSCPRDCPNRFQGCKCSTGNCHTAACPCWSAGRECEPDYCFTCGASDAAVMAFHAAFKSRRSDDVNVCLNVNMLRGSIQKKVGVAFSATHGWGAYALEPIRKDEFVLEYTGELITDEEAERRGAIYDRQSLSYLFGVNSEYVVDAARKGNKAKFANHREKEAANLEVRIIASNGEHRIGLFAREALDVGAELFFDYGYTHESAPKWSQHGQQQPEQRRAYDIVDDENEWEYVAAHCARE